MKFRMLCPQHFVFSMLFSYLIRGGIFSFHTIRVSGYYIYDCIHTHIYFIYVKACFRIFYLISKYNILVGTWIIYFILFHDYIWMRFSRRANLRLVESLGRITLSDNDPLGEHRLSATWLIFEAIMFRSRKVQFTRNDCCVNSHVWSELNSSRFQELLIFELRLIRLSEVFQAKFFLEFNWKVPTSLVVAESCLDPTSLRSNCWIF